MKIYVIAKTNSSKDKVEEIDSTHFKIFTKELPINGQANLMIIKLLADHFEVAKTQVTISNGFKSKNKVFDIAL